MEPKDKLIDKIRKLLALSKSPNENEAARAAEKVQALLAEHNLAMSEVAKDDMDGPAFVVDGVTKTSSRPWRRFIASAVAQLYFCRYFFSFEKELVKTRKCGYIRYDIHNFIGEAHNIAVAKLMFVYLIETVERLAHEGARRHSNQAEYITTFQSECAYRLSVRIKEMMLAAMKGEAKASDGRNLPALASLYETAQRQLKEFDPGVKLHTKPIKSRSSHAAGREDGRAAGDRIRLNPQIKGGKAAPALPRGPGHLLSHD